MSRSPIHTRHHSSIDTVARHSLLWLVVSCVAGLLLSLLLLAPGAGVLIQPVTYGRIVTVHLNTALYGWSAMPLIGLLFLLYTPRARPSRWAGLAVTAWSCALLIGVIGWATGHTSGKLFMEWSGASRAGVLIGMSLLAAALWIEYFRRLREERIFDPGPQPARIVMAVKIPVLLILTLIPFVMYYAADPSLYPPVNPDSGGATGGSLLGSTLAIVAIYWMTPFILGLERLVSLRSFLPSLFLLAAHIIAFAFLDHGDRSHHEPMQIAALSSVAIWVPLLYRHINRFLWPSGSRPWLAAFAGWALVLTATGLFTFMPNVLEGWKFTNALVAHSHIAMAGMVSNFNFLLLAVMNRRDDFVRSFGSPVLFWSWQIGNMLQAASLLAAGTLESIHPSWLFTGNPAMNALYVVRAAGGAAMLVAAAYWMVAAHHEKDSNYE